MFLSGAFNLMRVQPSRDCGTGVGRQSTGDASLTRGFVHVMPDGIDRVAGGLLGNYIALFL